MKGEQAIIAEQSGTAERIIDVSSRQNQMLAMELRETCKKLVETQSKVQQLRDINGNYTAEVKIQKRINSKLKKEMEVMCEKAKIFEGSLENEREKTELVLHR